MRSSRSSRTPWTNGNLHYTDRCCAGSSPSRLLWRHHRRRLRYADRCCCGSSPIRLLWRHHRRRMHPAVPLPVRSTTLRLRWCHYLRQEVNSSTECYRAFQCCSTNINIANTVVIKLVTETSLASTKSTNLTIKQSSHPNKFLNYPTFRFPRHCTL